MTGATILLVEDEETVRDVVSFHLESAGFTVLQAGDAQQAREQLEGADLLVLDRMLPGTSGMELLAELRRDGDMPVLLLTALGTEVDRVEGLEAGADDYLVKPFSAAELVARVRALLRRTRTPARLQVGEVLIDEEAGRVQVAGEDVDLTRREFDLLVCLAKSPGRVFSRAELLDRVWGEGFAGTERTVDQHVAQLRTRLGPAVIETVRGRGYRLPGEE